MAELTAALREKLLSVNLEERQVLRQAMMDMLTEDSRERTLFEVLLRGPKH